MPAAERRARRRAKRPLLQLISLAALVASALIAVRAELRAQQATGETALVLAADTALGDAMHAGDNSAVRRLLSLQFTYTDENGKIHQRKEFLADLKSAETAPATDVKATVYGLVAIVTGVRQSAQGSDTFILHIWAKQKRTWRVLMMQDVALAAADASQAAAELPPLPDAVKELAKLYECKNPCETIPYRVRSQAEQDVITTYQAIEKTAVAHDTAEYQKHLADEYMYYRSGYPPVPKSGRIAHFENEKAQNIPTILTAIHSMRLWVYGDSAVMVSEQGEPDDIEPLLRIARVWVKRNGQWQMAISVQTDVKTPQHN
jgi:hypothetical protein